MVRKPAKSKTALFAMDPTELVPYENNPRLNEQAIEQLMINIQEFGFTDPIVVDEDLVILAGRTRREAAIRLGLTEVPVIIKGDLAGAKGKAFRLAHNKAGEIAGWDFDKLDMELEDLRDDYDMAIFGFNIVSEIEEIFSGEESEWDDVDPVVDAPRSEGGYTVVVYTESAEDAKNLYTRLTDEGYSCSMDAE
jgi:hypothetical protein